MTSIADRLRHGRKEAGFKEAKDFCDAKDVTYPTYIGHENGTRRPKRDTVERYAKLLGVRFLWLWENEGPMYAEDLTAPEVVASARGVRNAPMPIAQEIALLTETVLAACERLSPGARKVFDPDSLFRTMERMLKSEEKTGGGTAVAKKKSGGRNHSE